MLLVALDTEGCASEVVACAGQLALDLNCGLELMTAVAVPAGVPPDDVLPGRESTTHGLVLREARHALETLAAPWQKAGVVIQFMVRFGKPEPLIVQRVVELKPRMLVMGTHARTGVARWVFGSVEESVVRRVHLPVVVVPAEGEGYNPSATLAALRAESQG
ncbi:MAG: nucleotide-binding universal stress UspA family protein [Myxococcota bacterium]|jgi:nucleotide-binding universal stress UspA family protein